MSFSVRFIIAVGCIVYAAQYAYGQQPDTTKHPSTLSDSSYLPDRDAIPYGTLFPQKHNSFYPAPPPMLKYGAITDTSNPNAWNVYAGPTVDSMPLGMFFFVPIDSYLFMRQQDVNGSIWQEMARQYVLGTRPDQVTQLLHRYTNIELPVNVPAFTTLFGKPEISIGVTGSADVHVAVRSDYTNLTGVSALGSTQTAPAFSQDLTVNVNGKIGDKLLITADWNTQRTFDYENQLKVKYTGYDDEIIRTIEAGNVSLQTPSRLIAGSQSLFGIKAVMQFGPFYLTTLASQKKGSTKTVSLGAGGGGLGGTIIKQAWDYSPNHYFLDAQYQQYYQNAYSGTVLNPPSAEQKLAVTQLEVWVTTQDAMDQTARFGAASDNLPPIPAANKYGPPWTNPAPVAGSVEIGKWKKLQYPNQYTFNASTGVLNIADGAVDESQNATAIAVAYQTSDGNIHGSGTLTGHNTNNPTDTIVLKLIRPKNLVHEYPSWNLWMKNIYSVGASNISTNGMTVTITYFDPPDSLDYPKKAGTTQKYITLLGLDKTTSGGGTGGDGYFDPLINVDVDTARGEIIFPYPMPFSTKNFQNVLPGTPAGSSFATQIGYDEVYDTTQLAAKNDGQHNRFYINIHYQGGNSNVINLNAFNIAPGSVRVYLSGQLLTPNVDYTEDDFSGTVTLRNPQAIQQISNVTVQYEQNDIFSTATRTLLGARGDLAISKNIKLGFTLFNYNEQVFTDKIRIGEEPISNWIGGIDGSGTFNLPFISKLLSFLPSFSDKTKTTLTLSGEVAYVMPNSNNNNSSVTSDGSQGTAMIDDFEGARYAIPLAGSYGFWHFASPPVENWNNGVKMWDEATLTDSAKIPYKALTYWYNVIPSDVLTTTIWPNRSVATPSEATTVLNFSFDPTNRGIYNVTPTLVRDGVDPRYVWGGVMRSIYGSPAPTDLTAQNVTDLEIWVKVITAGNVPIPTNAKMFFDLGLISEDVIPNGKLDTEDGILPDHTTPTGILYPGEDIGIDALDDAGEQTLYSAQISKYGGEYTDMKNDPAGDDWGYTTGSSDYSHINGLEGNGLSEFGRTPDSEDLNKNNALDAQNSYFEYEVDLDTTTTNPERVGAGSDGWTEIRIPLQKYARAIGNPSLQNVQTARVWFAGFNVPVTLRFAQMDLVGSRWIRVAQDTTGIADSNFQVTFVNIEDNSTAPDFYTSPPGVLRPRVPSITTSVVYENEQSLELSVRSLPKGQSRQAVQYESGLNLFNYKTLGIFVHGDTSFSASSDTLGKDSKADFFIRFGTDSLNFYEYRARIHKGWDDIRINFPDITAVKASRTAAQDSSIVRVATGGAYEYGSTFAILGQPTLTKVTYFSIGVANASGATISDSIWVDELRVIGSNNNNDWAAIINAGLQLGDLGQVQFSATQNNPDFHSMDTRFGDKVRHRTWSFSAQTGLERFLKFYPGLAVPFVYSHTESLDDPEYLPQSDISVQAVEAQTVASYLQQGYSSAQANAIASDIVTQAQTLTVRDVYSVNGVKVPIPTKYWLFDDTWNKLTYSFDYSKTDMRTPYIEHQETWGWNASIRYALQLKPFLYIKPFAWSGSIWALEDYKEYKINLMPSSFNAGIALARNETTEKDRGVTTTNPAIRIFSATRTAGFAWPISENGILNPTINYNLSIASTLLPVELIDSNTERPFSDVIRSMFFNNGIFNFGPENSLNQNVQLTMKPKLPKIFSIDRYTDVQSSYDVTYGWTNTLTQGDLGKSGTWTSKLQIGMNVKLKGLSDAWFGNGGRGAKSLTDSNESEEFTMAKLFDYAIRTPFLDYDAVNITFTQTNSSTNQGLQGGTGIDNFWRGSQDLAAGPNRLYQLGLISSPDGNLFVQSKSGFPFVQFVTEPGRRAIDATLVDNFQQANTIELRTSRELWKGATLSLNWKSQWNFNNNQTITTDSLGIPSVQNSIASLNISRSYLSLPPFLFLSVFNNTVSNVVSHYQRDKAAILATPGIDTATMNARLTEVLADDFENGFEALSFFPKAVQRILPRVNWTFRWEGLEKLPFFEPFAQRVSLEHTYTGLYTRSLTSNPDGSYSTQGQTISIGFQPLLAVNMTFKEKIVGGNLSAQARYNTTTSWSSQGAAAGTIEKDLTTEISVTATYTRQGIKLPLFGFDLKNDIEASFTFSSQAKSSVTYNINDFNASGTPLNGSTTYTMEPRITYTMSQRVRASIFYRVQRTIPDPNGSNVPETSTVEAGLDIHISISGGQ